MVIESASSALDACCVMPVTTNSVNVTNTRCHCCGKAIKLTPPGTCEEEDNLSIHRKPSTSTMSTISIRDSLFEGMNSIQRRGIRCEECCKSQIQIKERKAVEDEDDHHFRPPGEIFVDQRNLPPRPRKNLIISCKDESREGLVDLSDGQDGTPPLCNDSNSTPERRNSSHHDSATPVADNTTHVESFKPLYDRSRPLGRSGSSHGDMRTLSPNSNSENSFQMILVSVLDIEEVPSDELAGTGPTNSAALEREAISMSTDGDDKEFERGLLQDVCAENLGTRDAAKPSDHVGEVLELVPSKEEDDYVAKGSVGPESESENVQAIQRQPVSPSSPLHDKARTLSILRDDLDNSDSDDIRDEKAADEAYKGCADSADVCENSCSPKAAADEFDFEREQAPSPEPIPIDLHDSPSKTVEHVSRPTQEDEMETKFVHEEKWGHCGNPLTFLCSLH